MIAERSFRVDAQRLCAAAWSLFFLSGSLQAQLVRQLHRSGGEHARQQLQALVPSPTTDQVAGINYSGVSLWNPAQPRPLWSWQGQLPVNDGLPAISFSPDGTRLACIDSQNEMRLALLNAETGKPVKHVSLAGLTGDETLQYFNPAGLQLYPNCVAALLVDHEGRFVYCDLMPSGKHRLLLQAPGPVSSFLLSPDGKWLFTGHEHDLAPTLNVWNAETGEQVTSTRWQRKRIVAISQSADGRQLATRSTDGTVKLYTVSVDPQSGILSLSMPRTIAADDDHRGVALSRDGKFVVVPMDSHCAVYRVSDNETVARFPGGELKDAILVADGTQVVGLYQDSDHPLLTVMDVAAVTRVQTTNSRTLIQDQERISEISFSPDGRYVGFRLEHEYRVQPTSGGKMKKIGDLTYNALTLMTTDNRLLLFDTSSQLAGAVWQWHYEPQRAYHLKKYGDERISALAISADNSTAAIARYEQGVEVIPGQNGDNVLFSVPLKYVQRMTLSPDGQILGLESEGKTIFYDIKSKSELTRVDKDGVIGVSADSRYVVGTGSSSAWRVDLTTGEWSNPFLALTGWRVDAVASAFNQSAGLLCVAVTSESSDPAIYVWQVSSGELLVTLSGYQEPVTSLGISANGNTIYAGHESGFMTSWSIVDWVKPQSSDKTIVSTGPESSASGPSTNGDSTPESSNPTTPEPSPVATKGIGGSPDGSAGVWSIDTSQGRVSVSSKVPLTPTEIEDALKEALRSFQNPSRSE